MIIICFTLISSSLLCGCTNRNNPGSSGISYFVTAVSDLNNFSTHIQNNKFVSGDLVYVYCEFGDVIHNGNYSFNISYQVTNEDIGTRYNSSYGTYSGTTNRTSFNDRWKFNAPSVYEYFYEGRNYSVKVEISDEISQKNYSKTTYFEVLSRPYASITTTDNPAFAPFSEFFLGHGEDVDGQIVSYSWNFGDGGKSNEQNPRHTYNSEGNYQVILTVTDNDNLTDNCSINITVLGKIFTLFPTDDITKIDYYSNHTGYWIRWENTKWLSVSCYDNYGNTKTSTSYMKFYLPSFPSDTIVKKAKLRLCCNESAGQGRILVYLCDDVSWSEDNLSYGPSCYSYNSNSSDSIEFKDFKISSDKWLEWDVTNYIQNSLFKGEITLWLDVILEKSDYSVDMCNATFYSKENLDKKSPELYIELS